MKTILVDDEPFALNFLEKLCLQLPELELEGRFGNAQDALEFLDSHAVDLIVTDIEMPGQNGMEMLSEIRRRKAGAGVIFVTGYEQYAVEAFQKEAVSYIMKPCGPDELRHAVDRAFKLAVSMDRRIEIRTFGSFSVLIDGVPVHFSNSKAKELLALLVDRNGGAVPMELSTNLLWEGRFYDGPVKRLYRKAVAYLNHIFREKGLHFFVSERGSCHIIPAEADCDYFRLFQGEAEAASLYCGEYLTEYSWAEPTIGKIEQFLRL